MTWRNILFILLLIFVGLVSGLGGVAVGSMTIYRVLNPTVSPEQLIPTIQSAIIPTNEPVVQQVVQIPVTSLESLITQAVETIGPSVVTVEGAIASQISFFGSVEYQPVSGSGVIISSDGYILTNNHVVEDAEELKVVLADGTTVPAEIVGTDKFADLAILRINGQVPAMASLGNSDGLKPGSTVIAIGSPLGDFKNSVTVGVVSATGRRIDTGLGYEIEGLIQTDAAINSGNSGGPLINLSGEVIGINTLIIRGSGFGSAPAEGLGFAIPSNTVKAISDQIIQKGYFARPYLGIHSQSITPDISRIYQFPVEWGIYITEIIPGSPASTSNLQAGDIITKIGDISLDEDHPFVNALFAHQPGESVLLEIIRRGQVIQVQVTFGETKSQ